MTAARVALVALALVGVALLVWAGQASTLSAFVLRGVLGLVGIFSAAAWLVIDVTERARGRGWW